ncbi:hypothetical protein B0H14DRAFT_2648480 [Mycena olivaceomarginata]|nr:hypothetical protein B0H14DRAFT_2648480 [Mycena olivaceomarginata]
MPPSNDHRPAIFLCFPTLPILCGSKTPVVLSDIYDSERDHREVRPQILPDERPLYVDATGTHQSRSRVRSSGCGTKVHGGVLLTRRDEEQYWYGWTNDLAPTVVPLESRYFTSVVAQILRLESGREDCGVPGNGLGTVQTRCETHALGGAFAQRRDVYLFLASAVSVATPTSASREDLSEISWIRSCAARNSFPIAARNHATKRKYERATPTPTRALRSMNLRKCAVQSEGAGLYTVACVSADASRWEIEGNVQLFAKVNRSIREIGYI